VLEIDNKAPFYSEPDGPGGGGGGDDRKYAHDIANMKAAANVVQGLG